MTHDPTELPDWLDHELSQLLERSPETGDLQTLLDAHPEHAGVIREWFDRNADRGAAMLRQLRPPAPPELDDYEIVERLGQGGMGTVYLADQLRPVHRRVAIKVIKLGMDSHEVLVRFEAERQALALMDHPNVARVVDSGMTTDGRPFFAMDYVPGIPITRFCREHHLGVRQRLGLLIEVCRGVQHAHQNGIIHRDIKPSNVLVQLIDGAPVPKIIDFGVAKAIGFKLHGQSFFTEAGRLIGTPDYMSPEQAEMSEAGIDTRTDVYALGVLTYELLTGVRPLDSRVTQASELDSIRRAIREVEPQAPSARVTTISRTAAAVELDDPVTWARQLRGDLDSITLCALEKDPARRYQSASELAADIERHLRSVPIAASPPSALYRLRKFVRRNRVAVGVAATIAIAVLVAVGATVQGLITAQRHLDRFDLLANLVHLADARAAAAELYPPQPEKIEALNEWLERYGEPLSAELDRVRSIRDELRAIALPWSDEDRARDRASHPARKQLAEVRQHRAEHEPGHPLEREEGHSPEKLVEHLASLDAQIAALEQTVAQRQTYRFERTSDQFLHDSLTEIVDELEQFALADRGVLASVRARLRWASTIFERTVEDYRAEWDEAIAAVANADGTTASQAYAGATLTPQTGLVPLGVDPESMLLEFGHLASGALAERDEAGRLACKPETGMVFVLIPGGSFWMGAQARDPLDENYDPRASGDEWPPHRVELAPFFLSKWELTQGQFRRLGGVDRSFYHTRKRFGTHRITFAHPLERTITSDAEAVLSQHGMRLPTEAQWEYAYRAGTETVWWTGDDRESLRGSINIADQTALRNEAPFPAAHEWPDFEDGYPVHAPVDTLRPNPFGLHHMHGNVWEACHDWKLPYTAPTAPGDGARLGYELRYSVGGPFGRNMRGGSYNGPADYGRAASRAECDVSQPNASMGFRPVWGDPND